MSRNFLPTAVVRTSASLVALHATLAFAQSGERAAPVFVNGEAQVVEAFKGSKNWIQHDLWVETSFDSDGDGEPDRVHVDVTRPAQTESEGLKVAVVYESSPYFSGIGSDDRQYFWSPSQEVGATPPKRTPMPPVEADNKRPVMSRSLVNSWVPRGFAVVHSASPGTGLSEGCPTIGGENESLAPKAVIDWLNGRAKGFTAPDGGEEVVAKWSTGKVAMLGTSYNGTLALAAATTGVQGLEVVVPDAPNTSYYHYYRANGLIRHPGGYMGEDIDVLYDAINSGDPERRAWCDENVRDKLLLAGFDRVSGDYNAFWRSRDYVHALSGVKCAVFLSHGLSDWNVMPSHSIRIYRALDALGAKPALYLHQGGHGGMPPLDMLNRWFSHYLYDQDNGAETSPRSWIVREENPRAGPVSYATYPHPDAAPVRLHLRKGGEARGSLEVAPSTGQGVETVVDDASIAGAKLAAAEISPQRLLYATTELKAPLHLSGAPRVRIRMSSDRPAANLSVWLVALPWTASKGGGSSVITRGWADPQNSTSLSESRALAPGKFYEFEFELEPDDQILPAGRRLALMIFSSDHDFTLWPTAGTKLGIDLDGTSLELPVVGGKTALLAALGVTK